jgi:cytochrome c oxidase subunit IV
MSSTDKGQTGHVLSYRMLTGIWAALMALTATTIAVARMDLGFYNVLAAMGIATTKALLVVFFFMHLKYENRVLKWLVFLACLVLAIAIGFTFFDIGFRVQG